MLRNFFAREDHVRHAAGQTLVEYALIILFVAIAIVGSLTAMAGPLAAFYTSVSAAF